MEVSAQSLQIGYGERVIVSDFDIRLEKGKITSIIGPNGSGKSTLLKALTRLIRFQKGSVTVEGKNLLDYAPKELARKVGVLPQIHSAPADFLVKELVGYGRMPHLSFLSRMGAEDEAIVEDAMKATNTWHLRDKSIHEISGGETQRVWIATVLAQQPEILFLDEPTTYLDVSHQLETMQMVKDLNRKTGVGVVMVLHDLSHAMEVSDHIVVIKDGRKYAEGAPEEVITREMMREVYNVDCDVIKLPGRDKPLLAYKQLA